MKTSKERRLPAPPEGKSDRYYAVREWVCLTCGIRFKARRTKKHGDRKYCSRECSYSSARKAARTKLLEERLSAETRASEAVSTAITTRRAEPLTPHQSGELRGLIFAHIRDQVATAHQVVAGSVAWSPTQARVFSTLLNKVIPDLSAAYVQQEAAVRDLTELSREELEAIVAGRSDIAVRGSIIDMDPEPTAPNAPDPNIEDAEIISDAPNQTDPSDADIQS